MMTIIEIAFWVAAFLVLYTYVFYFLILVLWASIKPRKRSSGGQTVHSVSFVIAAYNEKKVIDEKIRNCLSLNYPKSKIEFIFGSDHSSDGTDDILRRHAKKVDRIRFFPFGKREGKASVINQIVPRAKGDILVFSDANTMYHADSVRRMVTHFADSSVGGVCGRLNLVNPNHNPGGHGETLYWSYENEIKSLEGRIRTVFGATGGIYAIRRRLFHALGKNRTNVSDDFLIPLQVVARGYDVVYDSSATALEYASSSMRDEFRRKVRIGTANVSALREMRPLLSPRNGYVALGLWSHKVIRWSVPFLMILLAVLNGFLSGHPFYRVLFHLQMLFYLSALLGWLVERIGLRFKPFQLCTYFVSMNLGLLVGYIRYATRKAKPVWDRLER
jgi:biofilm PGA synthesis N-glycosyltransferase PgaC